MGRNGKALIKIIRHHAVAIHASVNSLAAVTDDAFRRDIVCTARAYPLLGTRRHGSSRPSGAMVATAKRLKETHASTTVSKSSSSCLNSNCIVRTRGVFVKRKENCPEPIEETFEANGIDVASPRHLSLAPLNYVSRLPIARRKEESSVRDSHKEEEEEEEKEEEEVE
uniref:Uncharacterized protein n=1 Tax=Vespula pensylvanica TaxID=30213 RepID=A0A834P1E9_VESPE|nr:hypothetical protein H0235_007544 [Vespula pensylvanica]